MSNVVIIPCPPKSDYPESPKDQSKSELHDCPKCNEKMWLSEKKQDALESLSRANKEIILACYHCIKELVDERPELILNASKVNI